MITTVAFTFILASLVLGAQAQAPVNVTFLHVNDHHSHFEELSFDIEDTAFIPSTLGVNSTNIRIFYGGFPRVVSLMEDLEQQAVAKGNEVCKVHAGDALTGTLFYTFFNSDMDSAAMNIAGFEAFVLGNHEFDEGDSNLADFIQKLNMPALSYNLNPAEESALRQLSEDKAIKPYTIKTLSNGELLGICGITIKVTTELSSFPDAGTTIADEKTSAEACVADLQAMDVNKIVMLTHVGFDRDTEWMVDIPGVDVVIGGHSHSLLGGESFQQFGFRTQGSYGEIINGTCVVQAWEYSRAVGSLTVSFDAAGDVTACSGESKLPINANKYEVRDADPRYFLGADDAAIMTSFLLGLEDSPFVNLSEDPETVAALAPFYEKADESRLEVIAQVPESICHTYSEQSPVCADAELQNWLSGGVCNLVAQGFLLNVPTADVSIQNRGGCRTDIIAGDFTFGAAFDILPFSNTLVTLQMTGEDIHLVLEDAVNFFLDPELGGGGGSYPFAAGLRYNIDYTAEFGSRISELEVNRRLQSSWMPIELGESYLVVTNSFVTTGRDGYFTFAADKVSATAEDTFVEYAQSFVNYVRALGNITEPPLSEFSTQSITLLNGETFAVDEDSPVDEDPPVDEDSPVVEDTGSAAATRHLMMSFLGVVMTVCIGV